MILQAATVPIMMSRPSRTALTRNEKPQTSKTGLVVHRLVHSLAISLIAWLHILELDELRRGLLLYLHSSYLRTPILFRYTLKPDKLICFPTGQIRSNYESNGSKNSSRQIQG
jgi:hypothetical protein